MTTEGTHHSDKIYHAPPAELEHWLPMAYGDDEIADLLVAHKDMHTDMASDDERSREWARQTSDSIKKAIGQRIQHLENPHNR